MSRAFIFPGQGSQYLGMGKSLADNFDAARLVFEEIDDALNHKLSAVMWGESEGDLRLTANAQPALMAHSMAVIRVLETGGLKLAEHASHVAGHSLGEYSALCAAGTFSLADTARLLRLRGEAMQRAVPVGLGAMAAILGLEIDVVKSVCMEVAMDETVIPANDNGGGQIVISGHKGAVERAAEAAKEAGARRALLLPVSAPFHCPLMQPAAQEMAEALSAVLMNDPIVPVIANVVAAPISDTAQIKSLLVEQVTGAVRWRESVAGMGALGIESVVEIGAGKVLCGMVRRIDKSLSSMNIQDPDHIDAYSASL